MRIGKSIAVALSLLCCVISGCASVEVARTDVIGEWRSRSITGPMANEATTFLLVLQPDGVAKTTVLEEGLPVQQRTYRWRLDEEGVLVYARHEGREDERYRFNVAGGELRYRGADGSIFLERDDSDE